MTFNVSGGTVRALDGVSLDLNEGETLAIVGESGCGKTTLARAVLGLQRLAGGGIWLNGEHVTHPTPDQASRVGMVWQDPFASVDPLWRVDRILEEPFRLTGQKGDISKLIKDVGLDETFLRRYPHQMSGGQRQRVAIGRALALRPPLVICDEPTAALDLSIRAQILNLLEDIQAEFKCAYLFITHDLGTVRHVSDRVAVLYMGRVVEVGPTSEVFERPRHPYTKALLEASPSLENLGVLPVANYGEVPDPRLKITGCRYASRCPFKQPKCALEDPQLGDSSVHKAACFFPL